MIRGFLLGAFLLMGCGSQVGGPCQTDCDCRLTTAPVKCPGEWVCGPQKVCEYECKNPCEPGGVYTCRDGEDCNGSICSQKLACQP